MHEGEMVTGGACRIMLRGLMGSGLVVEGP